MKYDSDDALDRALFALPLEEPPADLRASILTATVYRPAPAFKLWELVTIPPVAAGRVGRVPGVVLGGVKLFGVALQAISTTSLRSLPSTSTLAWVALGGGTAIWLSLFTGFQPRVKGATQPNR